MLDTDRITTLTFDSYSTIVDVGSAVDALDEYVPNPEQVAERWRSQSLMYSVVVNDVDSYEPFYELNRRALTYALDTAGADVTDDEREEILSVYMDLHVFSDVRAGLDRLTDAYDCWVVSNGNPEMLDRMFEVADLHDRVEGYVSADEVETFKPDGELYRHAAGRIDTPIEEIAHVTAGWFDVAGAEAAGMQGVWVNRDDGPYPNVGPDPSLAVDSFTALADELGL
ncbi:haloacid dehalogenase type II [Halosegnis longus]|uniref:Haloacid dehalogenase type II n=1 Tax=Halosegnis longus TaxID=2216012 RepID=A0AAJ4RAC5_9EURY|nr:haloacid dehalogenase type II [Halosegnis longus]RNJ27190.1 haloacid dehalogenase type II [Salella cibi]